MSTLLPLPDGQVMCTSCTRIYRTAVTAAECTCDPALVDQRPPWNEDPPGWAVAAAMVVIWIVGLTVFVILPAYVAWH